MDNFNAFIVEILTIDYSYFWEEMNVVISSDGTLIVVEDEYSNINLQTYTFKPFTEMEIGARYEKKFFFEGQSPDPAFNLTQSAITDLLNLTKEQQRAQVDRLDLLDYFWRYDDILGEKGTIHKNLSGVNPYSHILALSYLKEVSDYKGINCKNVPDDIDKICLSGVFHSMFINYVFPKLIAIQRLVKATGIETGFWPRPSFESDLSEEESNNDLNNDYASGIDKSKEINSQEVEITVLAVAMVCVYLEKAGFFKFGTLKHNIEKYIIPKYGYSYNNLTNNFYTLRKDRNRLKRSNAIHIERAIKILPEFDLEAPVLFAEADLLSIKGIVKAKQQ